MLRPVLLACSHGTDNPTGQRVVSSVLDQVRVLLPDVEVIETYVDVQFPQIDTVILEVPHHRDVIVVPVLLSAGYHVHHDIAQAVAARNEATGPRSQAVATPALGPHPLLADLVVDRLRQGVLTVVMWCLLQLGLLTRGPALMSKRWLIWCHSVGRGQ